MKKNLSVGVSGSGTLLEAMIADKLEIKLVIADRMCRGVEIAKAAGLDVALFQRSFKQDFDREFFTDDIRRTLICHGIDFLAMAGFMTFFNPGIFSSYSGRILNTHPSLLPSFKGDHAVRDALASGVKVTGCTIHVATEKLDEGPILAQEAVRVMPNDTEKILHERIKVVERVLYPKTIREFAETI